MAMFQLVLLKQTKNNAVKKCSDLSRKLEEVQIESQLHQQRLQTLKLANEV